MKNDIDLSERIGEILRSTSRLNYLMRECLWDELHLEACILKKASGELETRSGLFAERSIK